MKKLKVLLFLLTLVTLPALSQTELLSKDQVEASIGLMVDTIYADSWRYTESLFGDCIYLVGLTEDKYRFISVIYVERHRKGHTLLGFAETCMTNRRGKLKFTDEGCLKGQIYKYNQKRY